MPAARPGLTIAVVGLVLSACGSSGTSAVRAQPLSVGAAPPKSTPQPATPAAMSRAAPSASTTDVTRDAARQHRRTAQALAISTARQVDYRDPLAVARGYVAARNSYRYDDVAGYRAALAAPAFTTPAFAARSAPSAAALIRLFTAHETSAVRIGGAELADEAPNSGSARYVVVTCTTTTTYRGGGSTRLAAWTVRLVPVGPNHWRVDGVLSAD